MNLALIQKLSLQEPKSLLERTVKLQEEVGELAQEILIKHQLSGSQHKSAGPDGVTGECVDVTIVALSIFFASGGTPESLEQLIANKCQKWEKHQVKPA